MTTVEQDQVSTQSLAVLAERTGGLYSLPGVAMEVLKLTKDPEVDAHKLKACIERDAALTVRLLRVVNSSLFGLSREVSDLGQAVAILGAKPLKLLVLGFSLPDALFSGLAQDALAAYWQNTLCKAVAARAIGDRFYNGRGDEGLIVGLLQDVGLLVLLQQLQTPFVEFAEKAQEAGVDLLVAEKKSLGFDHTQLSRRLLDQWCLPESIALAVEAHPDEPAALPPKAATLHKIVHAAGLLAHVLIDKRPDVLQELLQAEPFRNVPFEQLRSMVVELRDKVMQLAEVLKVSWSGELGYEEMLLDAQAQAASCSEDVLIDVLRAREEALAVQFDSSRLWSAFGQRQPTASIKPRTPNKQAAPQEIARTSVRAKRVCTTPVMGELPFSRELEHALTIGISASRQERSAASLLIAGIEQYEHVFPPDVHPEDEVEHAFRIAGRKFLHECLLCTSLGDRTFAFVVPHCERRGAVEAGHRILAEIRHVLTQSYGAPATNIRLACGVATVALPHKHFQGSDLFAAACRCLSAAQSAGGDAVKSIEIY